ncbi:MAG: NAD-dependent epimerase/dehydratase family protein [Actinomycetota bacterium]|jgi:UDP-glucose 4-epimerase|nr:NAD-dependent epimerase/dehydratase family protein [Actinomycetota bacterium]
MRVLVTGGAGFIGSNLVNSLIQQHEVGIIDDLSTGHRQNVHPDAWLRVMDILDSNLDDAVAEFAPDRVVHLAAQASVGESIKDPQRDWSVNAEGTRRVASAAAKAGATRVISASSAAVYGEPVVVPLPEDAHKEPVNPYGRSKLAAESLLAQELAPADVDFASFRFSNVYGPRQDWRGEGGVIAIFCAKLAEGGVPTIYGDGSQTRDFVFVGDVVAAITAALKSGRSLRDGNGGGPAYNVATSRETTVDEVAACLRGASGHSEPFVYAAARAGDVDRSALSAQKALDVFAWDARIPIERGLAETCEWFVQNG